MGLESCSSPGWILDKEQKALNIRRIKYDRLKKKKLILKVWFYM